MINVNKLHRELIAAGLLVIGVAETGRIDWEGTPTQEQLNLAQQILANHDPYDPTEDIKIAAETRASNIPAWALWTEEEALAWHNTNITVPLNASTTLAQAKAVLQVMEQENRALLRMVVALRDFVWPNLGD